MRDTAIIDSYKRLLKKYGTGGQWSLWCKRPKTAREKEEVIIGAILTQNTNWKNIQRALFNLKQERLLSLRRIAETAKKNPGKIANLIKPSGFYNTKSKYLANIADFFVKNNGTARLSKHPLNTLRKNLLDLKGVGPETADSILLYALEKPIFVIDEYTRRFAKREKLARRFSYDYLQNLFQASLPKNYKLYQDFHSLIVIDGKN